MIKRLIRFIVAIIIAPFMLVMAGSVAIFEWLGASPNWDFYKQYHMWYYDMLTFKIGGK